MPTLILPAYREGTSGISSAGFLVGMVLGARKTQYCNLLLYFLLNHVLIIRNCAIRSFPKTAERLSIEKNMAAIYRCNLTAGLLMTLRPLQRRIAT